MCIKTNNWIDERQYRKDVPSGDSQPYVVILAVPMSMPMKEIREY